MYGKPDFPPSKEWKSVEHTSLALNNVLTVGETKDTYTYLFYMAMADMVYRLADESLFCTNSFLFMNKVVMSFPIVTWIYGEFAVKVCSNIFMGIFHFLSKTNTVESINNDNCNNKNTVVTRHFSIPIFYPS